MSFSSEVKEEIARHVSPKKHCQVAELSSILEFCGKKTEDKAHMGETLFQTENISVVRKVFTLCKKAYNIDTDVDLNDSGLHNRLHRICLNESQLLELHGKGLLEKSCCKRAYLRGCFLSVGSVSAPEKSYHLEMVCNTCQQAEKLVGLLSDFDVPAKITQRKKNYIVYIKEGASIVDFLNIIEAHVSLMNFENSRIVKEVRNSVNRRVNCEAANITKTVTASSKQVEDIELIRDSYGFGQLSDALRDMAEVRLNYPDATLKELGEYLDPPVGKSGVNHRLRKLSELADRIREQ